jgi:hypothetical protein
MVMRRPVALLVLSAALAAACGAASADRSVAPTQSAAARSDVLVVGGTGGTSVIGANGQNLATLGPVVGAPGWRTAFAVDQDGAGHTTVRTIDVRTGTTTGVVKLDGAWGRVSDHPNGPSGLSPNARWLVLSERRAAGTAFRIVDTGGQSPSVPRSIELAGEFSFDAMSDDGESLYLVERLTGTNYRVRVVDVRSGTLVPGAIIDQKQFATTADANGVMSGTYTTAVAGPNGEWYFSVYQHPAKGPYIHALNTHVRIAQCILDLPTFGKAGPIELAKQPFWSLAVGQQGGLARLYAVNAALGQVALVDPYGIKVTKTATIKVTAPTPTPAAVAPGAAAAVSPDGYRLYALGETGIAMIDTAELSLRATFAQSAAFRGLAVSPDNATLYALAADGMSVAALDARTGRPLGTLALGSAALFVAVQKP